MLQTALSSSSKNLSFTYFPKIKRNLKYAKVITSKVKTFPSKIIKVLQINNLFQMLFAKQIKISLLNSSPDTENKNESVNQTEEFIQTSNEIRFESTRVTLLQILQIQTKWKVSFPFAFYSSSKDGYLYKLWSEYGKGDNFWRFKAVKFHQHSNQVFSKHADNLRHKATEKKYWNLKGIFINKRATTRKSKVKKKRELTRQVIKKIFKKTYFIARKKWAVRETFSDIIDLLRNIGDENIIWM